MRLAEVAEASGWDGFFLWDHSLWSWPEPSDVIEPWTVLGAIAQVTQTISIGTMITPIARRRPWQLAREVTTLDHLSGGRVILGVGLGSPQTDFIPFWSVPDHVPDSASQPELLDAEVRERRRRYEVGLELLERFLDGEVVDHEDELFTVREVELRPRPSAAPSIPILVGGNVRSAQAIGSPPATPGAYQSRSTATIHASRHLKRSPNTQRRYGRKLLPESRSLRFGRIPTEHRG